MRSATRAANWQSTLDDKNTIDNQTLPLEGVQNLSPEDQLIVEDLLNLQLKTEVAMYRPACTALRKLFGDSAPHREDPIFDAKYTPEEEEAILKFEARPGNQDHTASVFNTHKLKFLGGHAPDITICLDSTIEPAAETTISAFELKGPRKTPFESDMCGQVFDYLIRTSTAQKGRRNVLAILSTLNRNDLFHYRNDRSLLYIYRNISLADVIRFLKFVVLQSNSWRPPPSPYSADLGIPQQRLGQPSNSVVAKFTIPEALANNNVSFKTDSITGQTRRVFPLHPKSLTPNLMVVKRALKTPGNPQDLASAGSDIDPEEQPYDTTAVSDEIKILTHIHSLGGHDSLPHLLYHTADYRELATTPVGSHLKPRSKVSEVTDVLSDVLDALNWLHEHGIIHRDVRWDNIVIVHTSVPTRPIRGILIDLGESVQITHPYDEFPFRGGYICCPPGVVEDPGQYLYKPKPADDLLAWVLLVNMWMFRKPWKVAFQKSRMIVKKGSDENRAMEAFWTGLRTNRVWGEYYEAAVKGDIERLRGLLDVLYWV
ncbi:hypothetical protein K440DRAFT_665376 [Wilcoxina mikolae CBS 423.85]|nr:hypothetical protein K440DRAFT_665376 [Wilcoxina mikolae CBS 423.85]